MMSAPLSLKYFAVKTTVGQERNIARMMENRLQGVALKSGETYGGSVSFGGDVRCWQSFIPRKPINLRWIHLYLSSETGVQSPVIATIHTLGEDGLGEALAEARFDPLLMKGEGWQSLRLEPIVELSRNQPYVLIISSEGRGYRWYYADKVDEAFEGEARISEDGGLTWRPQEFNFLMRLVEDVDVASILILPSLKGYVFVEASSKEAVAAAVQNIRHVKNRPLITVSLDTISPHLVEKPLIDTIEVGQIVEIITGPLRGIVGKVIRVEKPRREVTLELREAAFQLPISVSIDAIRPLESAPASSKR